MVSPEASPHTATARPQISGERDRMPLDRASDGPGKPRAIAMTMRLKRPPARPPTTPQSGTASQSVPFAGIVALVPK